MMSGFLVWTMIPLIRNSKFNNPPLHCQKLFSSKKLHVVTNNGLLQEIEGPLQAERSNLLSSV
jgi:hypothetical protein